jgi:hypothetical protein
LLFDFTLALIRAVEQGFGSLGIIHGYEIQTIAPTSDLDDCRPDSLCVDAWLLNGCESPACYFVGRHRTVLSADVGATY